MKRIIFLIALIIPFVAFSQKLHKLDGIDYMPLTISPIIFDPNEDSTIVRFEFLQDTINNLYELDEEAKNSSIDKSEESEQVFAIGLIGEYRIKHNKISVIIKTHHINGEIKTFTYTEKIDKLFYFPEFEWATYGTKGVYYFKNDRRKVKPQITQKCDV